jgi:hypothetical protein
MHHAVRCDHFHNHPLKRPTNSLLNLGARRRLMERASVSGIKLSSLQTDRGITGCAWADPLSQSALRSMCWLIIEIIWILLIMPNSGVAQQQDAIEPLSDQQLSAAFMKKSVGELLNDYFQGPPYPLFAIRRLIDIGDRAAIPSLERAFTRESHEPAREFLAAALVSLGDPKPEYFEHVARRAAAAAASDLPFAVQLGTRPQSGAGLPPFKSAFLSWVRQHGGGLDSALWQATFDLPAAVEALGEAADPRSRPVFLQGLNSPNILIVFAAALGLARLQDDKAVPAIIAAAEREPPEERSMIAKTLLYFANSDAQHAAERLVNDPVRFQRWRVEVRKRGWKAAMRDRGH